MSTNVAGRAGASPEPDIRRARRPELAVESDAAVGSLRREIGLELARARRRRRWTQEGSAKRIGLTRQIVSRIERGSVDVGLEAIARMAAAVERPLTISLRRDPAGETADAGHLAMQELVLRVGRRGGWDGSFELSSRPAEPWRSIDVGLASSQRCRLIVAECWNTFGDVGAAARSSNRKQAEAEARAVALWGPEGKASLVWVVRATAANRALVARYPEVFSRRFPGSSRRWVEALTKGTQPPDEPGLVWCDVAATRLFEWRRWAK
jgi:transcriptional regulator with XRE-family HTH domain